MNSSYLCSILLCREWTDSEVGDLGLERTAAFAGLRREETTRDRSGFTSNIIVCGQVLVYYAIDNGSYKALCSFLPKSLSYQVVVFKYL